MHANPTTLLSKLSIGKEPRTLGSYGWKFCKPGPRLEGRRNPLDMTKSSTKLTCPGLGGALVMGQGN